MTTWSHPTGVIIRRSDNFCGARWSCLTDPIDDKGFSCGWAPTRMHDAHSTHTLHLPQTTFSETTMKTTDIETLIHCVACVNRQMRWNSWSDSQEIIFIACLKETRKTLLDQCEIVLVLSDTGVSIYGNRAHLSSFRLSSRVRNSKILALCSLFLSAVSVTPIADTDTATHGEQEPDMSMGKPGFTTTFILWNTTTMVMIDTTAVNILWPETNVSMQQNFSLHKTSSTQFHNIHFYISSVIQPWS